MADVTPVDYTSDVGRIRKLIPDIRQIPDPKDPAGPVSYIWSDAALQSFIDDELPTTWDESLSNPAPRATIYRAAAMAMVATANDVNLVLKKLVTEDLETDGPAVADKLLKAAAMLEKKAENIDAIDSEAEVFYAIFPPTDRQQRIEGAWGDVVWSWG